MSTLLPVCSIIVCSDRYAVASLSREGGKEMDLMTEDSSKQAAKLQYAQYVVLYGLCYCGGNKEDIFCNCPVIVTFILL